MIGIPLPPRLMSCIVTPIPGVTLRGSVTAMSSRSFQVVLEWDSEEEVWVTYVPALDFLSSFGDTKEEAITNTREAILGYIEAAAKEGLPLPSVDTEAELVCINVQVV